MKTIRCKKYNSLMLILSALVLNSVGINASIAQSKKLIKKVPASEVQTDFDNTLMNNQDSKAMDLLAISAKKRSIATLIQLAKERAGTPEEDIMLARVAENLIACSKIEFRIANRNATLKKKAVDYHEYHNYLHQAISYLNKSIKDGPDGEILARSYYLRGKAYQELKLLKEAAADYKILVDRYPTSPDASFACLALGDLLFDFKDYKQSTYYYNKLSNYKGVTYLISLDRLSLVHYMVDDIGVALKYIKMQINYIEQNPNAPGSENKDKALSNAAQFYATAIEKHIPGYDVLGALKLFKQLDKTADIVKPVTLFTNILRTKGFEKELDDLKSYAVKGELGPFEAAFLVNAVFDYQLNKRQYGKIKQTINELDSLMVKLIENNEKQENLDRIRHELSNAVTTVQKDFSENKNKSEGPNIGATLITLYHYSIKAAGNNLAIKTRAAYNLAETYFLLKKYQDATNFYRWVMNNGIHESDSDKKIIEDSELKSIVSRYEDIKEHNYISKDLKPISISKAEVKQMPEIVTEWMKWLSNTKEKYKNKPDFAMMTFESYRLYYSFGNVEKSIEKFKDLVATYPESEYAVAASSLIIDTYIASEDWKKTYDISYFFLKQKKWKTANYPIKLEQIAGDAYYKTLEGLYKNKDYKSFLKYTDTFITKYPTNKNVNPLLNLAASASIAIGDNNQALIWYKKLEKNGGMDNQVKSTANLTTATVYEDQFQFENAAQAYLNFLNSDKATLSKANFSAAELKNLKKKTLLYTWIQGNSKEVEKTINTVCDQSLQEDCDNILYLTYLSNHQKFDEKTLRKEYFKSFKGFASTQFIRSILVLQQPEIFSSDERKKVMQNALGNWEKIDTNTQYTTLSQAQSSIIQNLGFIRKQVKQQATIKLDPKAIAKRVKLVEENENFISKFLNVNWNNIKCTALNELANLYSDILFEIDKLPRPKGMNAEDKTAYDQTIAEIKSPFIKKISDYRTKAFELASSTFVDSSYLSPITSAYFSENIDKASLVKNRAVTPDALAEQYDLTKIALSQIPLIKAELESSESSSKNSDTIINSNTEIKNRFITSLHKAITSKNWAKISLLLQEGSNRKILDDKQLNTYKALSLITANSRPDGLPLLLTTYKSLDKDSQINFLIQYITAAFESFNDNNLSQFVEQFFELDGYRRNNNGMSSSFGKVLVQTSKWINYGLTNDVQAKLTNPTSSQTNVRTPSSVKKTERSTK